MFVVQGCSRAEQCQRWGAAAPVPFGGFKLGLGAVLGEWLSGSHSSVAGPANLPGGTSRL